MVICSYSNSKEVLLSIYTVQILRMIAREISTAKLLLLIYRLNGIAVSDGLPGGAFAFMVESLDRGFSVFVAR